MKNHAWHNLTQTERTITVRGYIPWNPSTSRRIWEACRQQATAHNRAVHELLRRPRTPLRKSTKRGTTGLYGLWLEWRQGEPKLADILQAIRRPGVALAKNGASTPGRQQTKSRPKPYSQEATTPKRRTRSGNTGSQAGRRIRPQSLFCSRKRRDRRRANIDSSSTRTCARSTTRPCAYRASETSGCANRCREEFEVRSVTLIERNPRSQGTKISRQKSAAGRST